MSQWMGYTNSFGITMPILIEDAEFQAMIAMSEKTKQAFLLRDRLRGILSGTGLSDNTDRT